ncbi:MAG: hypothetical protein AMXMBFR84_28660 [Candidatus Hydrogenedentota bacterium]
MLTLGLRAWTLTCCCIAVISVSARGETWDPAAADYTGRQGHTLYVSKLGDNSDGLSWATALHTIQAALDRIPDAQGGHRVIVRPDTYVEANLSVPFPGSKGSYNLLIGDVDGHYGSGKPGRVVIDSGDPENGFKSYDWWGVIRATSQGWSDEHKDPTFSAIVWDRWILRNLYVSGGDAGLFWDCTNRIEPFSIVVEDCVSIGRAFGGGVASCLSRPDEPITFRRCKLWSLDWWGDAAGMYVRVENPELPDRPDVVIDECTMVGPQCALKGGNYGFHTYMRIKAARSQLITLNFSQPAGTPTDGIIQSVQNGKYLHVDIEDSTLMGYKVFGVKVDKESATDIGYTVTGSVNAYVQFTQETPKGMLRMGHWPAEVFDALATPKPTETIDPEVEQSLVRKDRCEVTPFVWEGRICLLECVRPASGGTREQYVLTIVDAESGAEIARFGTGYSLASAFVHDSMVYVSASRFENDNWNDVTLFQSHDLKTWNQSTIVSQDPGEHLFNSSICQGPEGFVLAYESNDRTYPAFTTKFASSGDLKTWTKLPDAVFGTNRYTACPAIRYSEGYYYLLYLEHRTPRWYFETYIARSKDLRTWYRSDRNPVISPNAIDDGINASDPDLVEFEGKTYLYYAVGDQRTWMNIKRAVYDETMPRFLSRWFANEGVRDNGDLAGYHQRKANEAKEARQTWFRDAKFGLFVHWGPFSLHGSDPDTSYDYFDLKSNSALRKDYIQYGQAFNPKRFNATQWMDAAKSAGMKYVVFTSMHHDGYSMFDSPVSEYDSVNQIPGTDYVKLLTEAARTAELKIGFYYSLLDWYNPDFVDDLPKYVDKFIFPQVRALCTNYGPIDCVWFDGEWDHPATTWRAEELVRMIHDLQPTALVNDRLGKGERGKIPLADFYTREQPTEIDVAMGFEQNSTLWEACMTMGDFWQYSVKDTQFQNADELIWRLVDVVSRGGNLLLNVGPTPDGEIPTPALERLKAIGDWLRLNGEAIYGAGRSPFGPLPVGLCTAKANTLYLHLKARPDQPIALPGLQNTIVRAYLLNGGANVPFNNESKTIELPETWPDTTVNTIGIELDAQPLVQSISQ